MELNTSRLCITLLLLVLPPSAIATTVNRCQDQSGRLTFTALACPEEQEATAHTVNPTSGTTLVLQPALSKPAASEKRTIREVVVVGKRDDGCGNILSPEQRRRAIIDRKTSVGMSKRDVEGALGKPDKITSRNAEVRYYYAEKKGHSRQVIFDEHGCVKARR
jgi:hypothetical protein